eukprot:jgi/Mesvir1/29079/Mv18385-RA.1
MAENKEGLEFLFEKIVTPSDVGKLNRLVIPKHHAERFFPLDLKEAPVPAMTLEFTDDVGKSWSFRYNFWASSQSYVLTRGWSRFVKEKKLYPGDVMIFRRNQTTKQLYIGFKPRAAPPDSADAAWMFAAQPALHPMQYMSPYLYEQMLLAGQLGTGQFRAGSTPWAVVPSTDFGSAAGAVPAVGGLGFVMPAQSPFLLSPEELHRVQMDRLRRQQQAKAEQRGKSWPSGRDDSGPSSSVREEGSKGEASLDVEGSRKRKYSDLSDKGMSSRERETLQRWAAMGTIPGVTIDAPPGVFGSLDLRRDASLRGNSENMELLSSEDDGGQDSDHRNGTGEGGDVRRHAGGDAWQHNKHTRGEMRESNSTFSEGAGEGGGRGGKSRMPALERFYMDGFGEGALGGGLGKGKSLPGVPGISISQTPPGSPQGKQKQPLPFVLRELLDPRSTGSEGGKDGFLGMPSGGGGGSWPDDKKSGGGGGSGEGKEANEIRPGTSLSEVLMAGLRGGKEGGRADNGMSLKLGPSEGDGSKQGLKLGGGISRAEATEHGGGEPEGVAPVTAAASEPSHSIRCTVEGFPFALSVDLAHFNSTVQLRNSLLEACGGGRVLYLDADHDMVLLGEEKWDHFKNTVRKLSVIRR